MAYERTIWKNREVERPRTFEKIENPDGTITLVPAEGNIIEPGTPIIAENMNNIEQGIVDAHDLAQQAFQSASDGKILISGAITGKGIPTTPDDTFATMANNINAIETDKTGDATALAMDILLGKVAYVKGERIVGTMPNKGKQTGTITEQYEEIPIGKGYHDGTGSIKAIIDGLIPSNIKEGEIVGGVHGSLLPLEPLPHRVTSQMEISHIPPSGPYGISGHSNTSYKTQEVTIGERGVYHIYIVAGKLYWGASGGNPTYVRVQIYLNSNLIYSEIWNDFDTIPDSIVCIDEEYSLNPGDVIRIIPYTDSTEGSRNGVMIKTINITYAIPTLFGPTIRYI